MAKSAASVALPAARVYAGSRMGWVHHKEVVFATVAFSLLLRGLPLLAQKAQVFGPEGALQSILSLSPAESAQALAIVRHCDPDAARILSLMLMPAARRSFDAGDLGKSAFLYDCAAEAARESKDERLLAEAEYRLGTTCFHSRDYRRAENSLLEGARLSEKHKLDIGLINNLGALGDLYIRLAKYDAAEQVSKRALALITGSPNRSSIQHPYGEALVSGNLGTIAAWNGEHTTALRYLGRAVELFEALDKKIGGYKSSALANLIGIGQVYYALGNYREALDYYGKVLVAAEEYGYTDLLRSALIDLGVVYIDQVDYVNATEFFNRSLDISNKLGDLEGATIATCNLGVSSERQGMYERAGQIFNDCFRLANQAGRPNRTIPALEGLATVYRRTAQNKLALEYYDRALQTATELGNKSRQSELAWCKAGVYHDLREYKTSIEFSERARSLADEIHEPNYSYLALTLIGKNYLALGQYEPAQSALAQAIQKVEDIRNQVGGQEQQKAYFLERKIEPYYLMVDLLLRQNKPEEALEFAERARSRGLLDLVAGAKLDISRAMSPEERAEEQNLEGRLRALNTQLFREYQQKEADTIRINALNVELGKARINYDSFLDRLYASHPELKVDRAQVLPFSMQDAKASLKSEDALAVEFQVLDDKVLVFTIELTSGTPRITTYQIAVTRKTLSEKVELFRARIANNSLGVDKLSSELFQLLLGPAARILDNKNTVVVVPDDVLWELPFQALRDSSGHYLIETHPLFYAPSLTALREMMKRESAAPVSTDPKPAVTRNESSGPSLLAFGDPELSAGTISRVKTVRRDAKLGPIPQTKEEVATLGSLYGASRSELFVGDGATEERAKAEMSRFKVLHFATHGILDGKDPLYSYILLSRSGSTEDGLLEAREIMTLNLTADIAILSACDTARGRISSGEGVMGMTWALFVAGCPTTVVSQWSVESQSTTKLMIEFHRALLGRNKQSDRMRRAAEALRDAQLKMLKTQVYRHPFYWAGFVVVGNGW